MHRAVPKLLWSVFAVSAGCVANLGQLRPTTSSLSHSDASLRLELTASMAEEGSS